MRVTHITTTEGCTMFNRINLETVWEALHGYRERCIPEGNPENDREWSDICTEMAWIAEELGIDNGEVING